MKTHTNKSLGVYSSLALAAALAIWYPLRAQSAEPAEGKPMMMGGKMMGCCQEMTSPKPKGSSASKAQEADLAAQIAKMNSAPQDQKLGLMAAIITRMAEQQIAADGGKSKMNPGMMMSMQMGKDSMSACPMMTGMNSAEEKPSGDHQEHH